MTTLATATDGPHLDILLDTCRHPAALESRAKADHSRQLGVEVSIKSASKLALAIMYIQATMLLYIAASLTVQHCERAIKSRHIDIYNSPGCVSLGCPGSASMCQGSKYVGP